MQLLAFRVHYTSRNLCKVPVLPLELQWINNLFLLCLCSTCSSPGLSLQQYEHTSWVSVVEVWTWDSISSAEKIFSISCNNEVVGLKFQLCHVFCVFFIGLAHPHLSDRRWGALWEGLWRNWCNVCTPSSLKYCVEMTHCHKEGIEKL